jgi:hypothetical protein
LNTNRRSLVQQSAVRRIRFKGGTLSDAKGAMPRIAKFQEPPPDAVTKEKAAEIAADFMTTFYDVQVGALEAQEFREEPTPFWLICFSDAIKGRCAKCSSWSCFRMGRLLRRRLRGGRKSPRKRKFSSD